MVLRCPVCNKPLESSSIRRFVIDFNSDNAEDIGFDFLDGGETSKIEAEKGEYVNVCPNGKHQKTKDIKNVLNDVGSKHYLSIGQKRAIVVLPSSYCNKCKLAIPTTDDMNKEDLFKVH